MFNDNLTINDNFSYTLQFISNNTTYEAIEVEGYSQPPFVGSPILRYGNDEVYHDVGAEWLNEAYKTITITSKLSEVTNGDELLALLQANATKQ